MAVPENIIRALDRYARACVEMGVNPGDDEKARACVEERIALVRLLDALEAREETWRRRAVAIAEAMEQVAGCEEHKPCGACRERLRAAFVPAPRYREPSPSQPVAEGLAGEDRPAPRLSKSASSDASSPPATAKGEEPSHGA